MQVGPGRQQSLDFSRIPNFPRRNNDEIKLAPSNQGNFGKYHMNQPHQQAQQHNYNRQQNFNNQAYQSDEQYGNRYDNLQNDSDGSEAFYSRGRNNRNKKHSPPPQQQPQHQQHQQAPSIKFKILPPGQTNSMPTNKPPVRRNKLRYVI